MDRLPPSSPQSEQCVLSCILQDPQQCLPRCIEFLRANGDEFYDLRYREIFRTCLELWDERDPVNPVTVAERLRAWNRLEQVGGMGLMMTLPDAAPSAVDLDFYLKTVREKFLLRRAIHVGTEIASRCYEETEDVDSVMDGVERELVALSNERVQSNLRTAKELVKEAINSIEERWQRGGKISGLPTGWSDLDRALDGLHPGHMIVVAARPSVGKSSWLQNVLEHVTLVEQQPVGLFSLEMTSEEIIERMIASQSRVNLRDVNINRDAEKLTSVAGKLSRAPIHIDDTGGMTIMEIRAKARRMVQQHGVKLIGIDYLQLVASSKKNLNSRQEEVADVSRSTKTMAKELGVPVIVLAQLNRDIEREKNRRPRMSDLRESGAIEQDADVIGFLYKPGTTSDEDAESAATATPDQTVMPVNFLIGKQRGGIAGAGAEIPFVFHKKFTKFQQAAKVADDAVPAEVYDRYQ